MRNITNTTVSSPPVCDVTTLSSPPTSDVTTLSSPPSLRCDTRALHMAVALLLGATVAIKPHRVTQGVMAPTSRWDSRAGVRRWSPVAIRMWTGRITTEGEGWTPAGGVERGRGRCKGRGTCRLSGWIWRGAGPKTRLERRMREREAAGGAQERKWGAARAGLTQRSLTYAMGARTEVSRGASSGTCLLGERISLGPGDALGEPARPRSSTEVTNSDRTPPAIYTSEYSLMPERSADRISIS